VSDKKRRLEIVAVEGNPTAGELEAAKEVIARLVDSDRAAATPSVWLRAARSQGRRLGMFDYRDRFERAEAWRLSTRFPFGGREYPGRYGRGDTK
jgi:hypothetical protein